MVDTYPFGWVYVVTNVGAWLVAPTLLYFVLRYAGRCRRRSLTYRARRARQEQM